MVCTFGLFGRSRSLGSRSKVQTKHFKCVHDDLSDDWFRFDYLVFSKQEGGSMIFVRLYMDRHLTHLHSFPLMESHIYIYVACILYAYSFHRVSRETYTFGRDSFYLIEYLWMLIINSVFFNIFLRFVFSIYSFIKYFQLCISEILLYFRNTNVKLLFCITNTCVFLKSFFFVNEITVNNFALQFFIQTCAALNLAINIGGCVTYRLFSSLKWNCPIKTYTLK